MVDKVALGQVFSEYFGFPCQSSFHQLLHHMSPWCDARLVPGIVRGSRKAYWTMIREQQVNLLAGTVSDEARELLDTMEEDSSLQARPWGDSIELWLSPKVWASEMTIPVDI
jgi:hypothetical protein